MFAAPRCAGLSDSESDDDDPSWDWEDEAEVPQPSSRCLFCLQTFLSTEKTWRHTQETHGFDITEAKQRLHLDSIGYIKMVNYIRQQEVYFSPSVLIIVMMLVVLVMYSVYLRSVARFTLAEKLVNVSLLSHSQLL